jgi:hypothetical protein
MGKVVGIHCMLAQGEERSFCLFTEILSFRSTETWRGIKKDASLGACVFGLSEFGSINLNANELKPSL